MKLFGFGLKPSSLAFLAGVWLIVDAFVSLIYSTDLIWLFGVGRIVRLAVGLLLLADRFPKSYAPWIGLYLALEAIGSTIISPDDAPLWQAGRIGRVFIGAWLYEYYK
ncbi:hypothetical protein HYV43_01050 [Candidatus Micrarchaeota archaeon]|nr:hypothetical protein [Candidatus Micrarchaeota archaeon]